MGRKAAGGRRGRKTRLPLPGGENGRLYFSSMKLWRLTLKEPKKTATGGASLEKPMPVAGHSYSAAPLGGGMEGAGARKYDAGCSWY